MRGREQWGYESGGSISDDSSDFYDGYSDASSVYFERRWRPPTIHIEFSRGPSPARRPSLSPPPPRYRQQVAAAEWPPMLPEIAEERLKRLCEERGLDPDTFMCPITRAPMRSPAVACDGHTYERGAIERWLAGNDKSPITGSRMMTRLVPNVSLRTLMYSLFCGNN
ncbi:hypothetical protein FOL46_008024 [Perkinsus olseni]|uniref:U-box domain-containing protein n=1 Tax=Perkinsus olseni TaxID=32597 RepID=A0A7J6LA49_PEROL|nr:hypothetical protein FOL46_008024 [Perkinsus olseni]